MSWVEYLWGWTDFACSIISLVVTVIAFLFAAKQYKRWKALEQYRKRKIAEAVKELREYTNKPLDETDYNEFGRISTRLLDLDPDIDNPIKPETPELEMWNDVFDLVQHLYWPVRVQDFLDGKK